MKTKNKIILSFILMLVVLIINTKVQAASASISASSKNIKVGESVTITTKISGAAWQINLSGAVSASYSDSTSDAEDTVKTETTKFKPSKKGNYTINLNGNVTGSNDSKATTVKDSVTIKVTEVETEDDTENDGNSVSSDATLKNLGITPNDFSGFKKNTTSYSITVPNSVDKVTVYAKATDSNAKVSGTGSKSLKVGKNTVSIKVTAEDKKTTKTYTINITRKEKETTNDDTDDTNQTSKDATLKDFGITPKQYDFSGFRKSVTNYSTTVPNTTESITIYAKATDSKATVTGTGTQKLDVGTNKFTVKVTAEDKKTVQNYNITVIRKEETQNDEKEPEQNPEVDDNKKQVNSLIKNIKIAGYTLTPEFKAGVNEYKVSVEDKVDKLNISAEEANNNVKVEIAGNNDLKAGSNVITLVAYDEKNDITETYQIYATIGEEEINIETYNYEVQQAQAGLKKKNSITYAIVGLIILLGMTFIMTRHIIKRHYAYEGEGELFDEESDEIDNKYSIFNNEQDEFNQSKKDIKGRNRGRRFK